MARGNLFSKKCANCSSKKVSLYPKSSFNKRTFIIVVFSLTG